MSKRLGPLLLIAAIVAGGLWWKRAEDRKNHVKTLQEAMRVVSGAEAFEENRSYFTALIEQAHPRAFELAYTSGHRLLFGRLNEDLYTAELLKSMREQARRDQREDIDQFLSDLEQRLNATQ